MSLKDVLEAQQSGELDLLTEGSAFNQPSPLVIQDGCAYVLINGDEWYWSEINIDLVVEALELLKIKKNEVEVTSTEVIHTESGRVLFTGQDISDLLMEIVNEGGIYTERH